ncbi:GNAT family N-acetyltransferase [Enterococcus sp. LJL98]
MELKTMSVEELTKVLGEIFEAQTIAAGLPVISDEVMGIAAMDGEKIAGGIVVKQTYESMYIHLLAVDDAYRGQRIGSQLMEAVEKLAIEREMIHLTLTTKSYQALAFYQKQGYEVFGELADMPMRGVTKYYLSKRLRA